MAFEKVGDRLLITDDELSEIVFEAFSKGMEVGVEQESVWRELSNDVTKIFSSAKPVKTPSKKS